MNYIPVLILFAISTVTQAHVHREFCKSFKRETPEVLRRRQDGTPGATPFDQKLLNSITDNTQVGVNVHFHVICTQEDSEACASKERVMRQFEVMKGAFATMGFMMNAVTIQTIVDDEAFYMRAQTDDMTRITDEFRSVMARLRIGGREDLNIYIKNLDEDGALGMNSFEPSKMTDELLKYDGVVMDFRTLPGFEGRSDAETFRRYNQGKTMIHEVGHWFGLFHPFSGGCGRNNDIRYTIPDDTPASLPFARLTRTQKQDYYECRPIKSCPNSEGMDPNWNYMDYSPDKCMSGFSKGQRIQAHFSWLKWRVRVM